MIAGTSILKDGEPLAANLIEGVPTKISYIFEIPQEVNNLAVVEVNYRIPAATVPTNSIDGKVAIRDINIGACQASNSGSGKNCVCPAQANPKNQDLDNDLNEKTPLHQTGAVTPQ